MLSMSSLRKGVVPEIAPSFGWLLVQDQIHPLFVYFLQVYLTF